MNTEPSHIVLTDRHDGTISLERSSVERPHLAVEQVQIGGGGGVDFCWSGPTHYLALHDLRTTDSETRLGDLRACGGADLVDTMTFAPAGHEVRGWSQFGDRRNGFTAVYFDADTFSRDLSDRLPPDALQPRLYFREPSLLKTLQKLQSCLKRPVPDQLYIDALGVVLTIELARTAAVLPDGQASGLPQHKLDQVIDLIESQLQSALRLQLLADTVGMSRFHFLRAFKASTGLSPHQFVVSRRVAKARDLLSHSTMPLAEIARLSGFGSPAHFARVFSAVSGMTPSEFRRAG